MGSKRTWKGEVEFESWGERGGILDLGREVRMIMCRARVAARPTGSERECWVELEVRLKIQGKS